MSDLSRTGRRWTVAVAALLVFTWCAIRNGHLLVAWGLPDVLFYEDMALGRYDLVPQPFSARLLAPLLARQIARATHADVQHGFAVLTYVSLLWSLLVVFWLLCRSKAPRWVLAAVAIVPFWTQLLGFAGLPDPLYTALLATVLLMLELGWVYPAAGMMLPLMLARESTSLVLICFLMVCWPSLRWRGSLLAIGSAALGGFIVHRFSASSLPNPEHLSGAAYMFGKIVSNSLRSVGVEPWSNVYPYLCGTPVWQTLLHLGSVHSVGVCSWESTPPRQVLWAFLTTFGVLPILLLARRRSWTAAWSQGDWVLRFCLLYGGISLLLAPMLGTWYVRLFGYAWPLLLVAVPRLLESGWGTSGFSGSRAGVLVPTALLLVQVAISTVANLIGTSAQLAIVMALQVIAFALVFVQRQVPAHGINGV